MSTTTTGAPALTAPPAQRKIPFLDLVTPHVQLEAEFVEAFRRAVRAAAFVGGAEVAAFEQEFATYCRTAECVGVANGTDSLRFAYLAMGVRPGDEVITVPNTFIATTEALTQVGAKLVFVDVDPATMNMNPALLEGAITSRTVGIVPVHLYGQPANMDAILSIAARHHLWVVEDAAQAQGARYKGRMAGSMGAIGSFSFYPGKNLGALGEAGAVVTSDGQRASRIRMLREHGQKTKYYHDIEGYNGRLDAIQAAFLRIKLRRLDAWNDARRQAAAWYREALGGVEDVRLPGEEPGAESCYHLFVVRVPDRDALMAHLGAHGVSAALHYPLPLHLQRAYASGGWKEGQFPVAEESARTLLSLPMFPGLSQDDVSYIADIVRSYYR